MTTAISTLRELDALTLGLHITDIRLHDDPSASEDLEHRAIGMTHEGRTSRHDHHIGHADIAAPDMRTMTVAVAVEHGDVQIVTDDRLIAEQLDAQLAPAGACIDRDTLIDALFELEEQACRKLIAHERSRKQ